MWQNALMHNTTNYDPEQWYDGMPLVNSEKCS